MTLVLTVVLVALIFEYINGFHDTANSIATVVSTKVLTPRQAIILAATTNLVGALFGTAVAKTISSGLVDAQFVNTATIISALMGGVVWNLTTWWFGLPSSSSHALVGGLVGATLATSKGNWEALIWSKAPAADAAWYEGGGILYKVILPMVSSPIAGLVGGLLVMGLLQTLFYSVRPLIVSRLFVIKTLGHKMVKLQPVHGFAAETTAAAVLFGAASLGMPVSTTHAITTSIMGVGAAKRWNAIKWTVVERIIWAWVLTIPATSILGFVFYRIFGA